MRLHLPAHFRPLLLLGSLLSIGLLILQLWTGDAWWAVRWFFGFVQDD